MQRICQVIDELALNSAVASYLTRVKPNAVDKRTSAAIRRDAATFARLADALDEEKDLRFRIANLGGLNNEKNTY